MDKNAWWKWLILLGLVVLAFALVYPPGQRIKLGLDLRGGTSFTIQIDRGRVRADARSVLERSTTNVVDETAVDAEVDRILKDAQERAIEVIRNRIDNLGIAEPMIFPGKDDRITVQLPGIGEEKRMEAEKSILSVAYLEFRMVHEKNSQLVADLFEKGLAPEGYIISRHDGESVYKRDPRVADSAMTPELREKVRRFMISESGAGYEFLLEKETKGGETYFNPCFVERRPQLKGDQLQSAAIDYRDFGQPVVALRFDARGAKKFAQVTTDYAPGGTKNPGTQSSRQLAIVLDGTLYSAPVIREPIKGGRAEISGNFTVPEAKLLANILKAGSLPAPVRIIEKRYVSPSLGVDSIRSGMKAVMAGAIGVVLFMVLYYRLSGIVANIALLLNMILLPVGMWIVSGFLGLFTGDTSAGTGIALPVLTLPGIAGIVLTVGMAVDANVLIFERIREELKAGKRVWAAIMAGYERAFVTILDSNLTTLLAGVILFLMGAGPIRGFAVTLCAGIAVSMFTALVVTKLLFEQMVSRFSFTKIRMMSMLTETSIDFLSKKSVAIVLSLAVIGGSWGVMYVKESKQADSVYGIDFTGGTSVSFSFKTRVPIQDIRGELEAAGLKDVHLQYQSEMDNKDVETLSVRTGIEKAGEKGSLDVVKDVVTKKFADAGYKVEQEDEVGAQVGSELKRKAWWAVAVSLIGMIIYISWRFEFGFALGAIVALAHDVLVTIGVFSFCGAQFSLIFVAALLTIVGYSVNDTIVIFDRVREDLKYVRNKPFAEICNLSINQTLSRTILTTLTTMITVVMLLVLGGGAIFEFALALFIGMIAGTYSTIFIATPVVLAWYKGRKPSFAAGN